MLTAVPNRFIYIACAISLVWSGLALGANKPAPASDDKKAADKKDEPTWQPIADVTEELTLKTKSVNVKPRTSRWRLSIVSEGTEQTTGKPNQDHSYIKLNLWIEDTDPQGNKILRPINVNFKKRAGASYADVYDNGLKDDGTPNTFQIGVSGTFVKYRLLVEDLGPAPEDQTGKDKPKKKK